MNKLQDKTGLYMSAMMNAQMIYNHMTKKGLDKPSPEYCRIVCSMIGQSLSVYSELSNVDWASALYTDMIKGTFKKDVKMITDDYNKLREKEKVSATK